MHFDDLDRCPTLEIVIGDDGEPCWQISGLGMSTRHRQLWQVETHWQAMLAAKGLREADCPPIKRFPMRGPTRGPWPVPDPGV
jgi:hypothetical protein